MLTQGETLPCNVILSGYPSALLPWNVTLSKQQEG